MASGLFVLLEQVGVLMRKTAVLGGKSLATLDDISLAAVKASAKSVGVIVDDAAVTPQYVDGIDPKRELHVIWEITKGSLRNKFLFVIPAVMILSWLAPWILPYLLILGGAYLVFEGAEKVLGWLGLHHGEAHEAEESPKLKEDSSAGEKRMIGSAVRTDLVLSTEIMLISLSALDLVDNNWISRVIALVVIGALMTVLVYGAVALLVRADDLGLKLLLDSDAPRWRRRFGFALVKSMPAFFSVLTVVGTVAMLWVGGHLLWKSLGDVGWGFASHSLHAVEELMAPAGGFLAWLGDTFASALVGLAAGLVLALALMGTQKLFAKIRPRATHHSESV